MKKKAFGFLYVILILAVLAFILRQYYDSTSSKVEYTIINTSPYVHEGEDATVYRVLLPITASSDDLLAVTDHLSNNRHDYITVFFYNDPTDVDAFPYACYEITTREKAPTIWYKAYSMYTPEPPTSDHVKEDLKLSFEQAFNDSIIDDDEYKALYDQCRDAISGIVLEGKKAPISAGVASELNESYNAIISLLTTIDIQQAGTYTEDQFNNLNSTLDLFIKQRAILVNLLSGN